MEKTHERGGMNGDGNGLFGANDTLTGEMAFVILARTFDLTPSGPGEGSQTGSVAGNMVLVYTR